MPDFPIVDTHVHLWKYQQFPMPWLENNPSLKRDYALDEYHEQTRDVPIEAMVFMEVGVSPSYPLLEIQYIAQLAQTEPRLQGIIANAPMEDGEYIRSYLQALVAIDPRIKGVRRNIEFESEEDICLRPDFVRGVQLLPEFGLSFDLCLKNWQLPHVIKLVRQCPDTAFILDHLAKPAIKAQQMDPWREQILELASLPNVCCKISGMVSEADPQGWTAEDLAPYLRHVLFAFGEDRVVYGSDWPVMLGASSYVRWVETVDALTSHLSPEARRKLWTENGKRFYRLPSTSTAS